MIHPAQTHRRPIHARRPTHARAAAAPSASFTMAALTYLAMALAVILAGYFATSF
jgi:hypothetical protein